MSSSTIIDLLEGCYYTCKTEEDVKNALTDFQKAYKLTANGLYTPETEKTLQNVYKSNSGYSQWVGEVKINEAIVRRDAGKDKRAIAKFSKLGKNALVTVLGVKKSVDGYNWYRIKFGSNTEGFIYNADIKRH